MPMHVERIAVRFYVALLTIKLLNNKRREYKKCLIIGHLLTGFREHIYIIR
jgi:hypothetical protein